MTSLTDPQMPKVMQRGRQQSLSWQLLLGQRCRRWLLVMVISRDTCEEEMG